MSELKDKKNQAFQARAEIKNQEGHKIGEIIDSGGRISALDKNGHPIGYFDKDENATYKADGQFHSEGNSLPTLLLEK